ncbi:MAG: ribosome silencing factor [Polyangiaceae bacterium]|nr:ribosome silencing factor [Polyangiaceae bacterium]
MAERPARRNRSSTPSDEARRIALAAAQAGLEKKALNVQIVDVTGKVDYADFLVLMTGQSDRHVTALAEAVDEQLVRVGSSAISVEGLPAARWVLIDAVDVVIHVFVEEARSLYDLDGLWLDARRVPLPEPSGAR